MPLWNSKLTQLFILITLLSATSLFVLAPMVNAKPAQRASHSAQATPKVAGTYMGNVIVSKPAPLGALALVLAIQDDGGQLSGKVDETRTLVFLGGPTFTGNVSASNGVTATFSIDSQTFQGKVSGRMIERAIHLNGQVHENGDRLEGTYSETISGFTPKPMIIQGTFILVRPSASQQLLPPFEAGTATPVPPVTPFPSVTPVPPVTPEVPTNDRVNIYLPLAVRGDNAITQATETSGEPADSGSETSANESPSTLPTPETQPAANYRLFLPEVDN